MNNQQLLTRFFKRVGFSLAAVFLLCAPAEAWQLPHHIVFGDFYVVEGYEVTINDTLVDGDAIVNGPATLDIVVPFVIEISPTGGFFNWGETNNGSTILNSNLFTNEHLALFNQAGTFLQTATGLSLNYGDWNTSGTSDFWGGLDNLGAFTISTGSANIFGTAYNDIGAEITVGPSATLGINGGNLTNAGNVFVLDVDSAAVVDGGGFTDVIDGGKVLAGNGGRVDVTDGTVQISGFDTTLEVDSDGKLNLFLVGRVNAYNGGAVKVMNGGLGEVLGPGSTVDADTGGAVEVINGSSLRAADGGKVRFMNGGLGEVWGPGSTVDADTGGGIEVMNGSLLSAYDGGAVGVMVTSSITADSASVDIGVGGTLLSDGELKLFNGSNLSNQGDVTSGSTATILVEDSIVNLLDGSNTVIDGLAEFNRSNLNVDPFAWLKVDGTLTTDKDTNVTSGGTVDIGGNASANGVNVFSDPSILNVKPWAELKFGPLSNNTLGGNTTIDQDGLLELNGGQTVVPEFSVVRVDGKLKAINAADLTAEPDSDLLVGEKGGIDSEAGTIIRIRGRGELNGNDVFRGDVITGGDAKVNFNGTHTWEGGGLTVGDNSEANVNDTLTADNNTSVDIWSKLNAGPTAFVDFDSENNLKPNHIVRNGGFMRFNTSNASSTNAEGGEIENMDGALLCFNGQFNTNNESFKNDGSTNFGPFAVATLTNSEVSGDGDWLNEGGIFFDHTNAVFGGPFGNLGGSLFIGPNSTVHWLLGAPVDAFMGSVVNVEELAEAIFDDASNISGSTVNIRGDVLSGSHLAVDGSEINVGKTGFVVVEDLAEFRFGTTVNTEGSFGIGDTGSAEVELSIINALAGSKTINNNSVHLGDSAIFNLYPLAEYINNGHTIVDPTASFNLLGGFLKGTGVFEDDVDIVVGGIGPGSSAGTLTIIGNFSFGGSAVMEIEIGGFTPGLSDFLDITGTADLSDGTIDFSFLPGYDIASEISPGQSMVLQFLQADGGIINFASAITYDFLGFPAGFQYDVYHQDNGLFFKAINTNKIGVIPAPGAIILGGIGAGLVGWLRRRRTL